MRKAFGVCFLIFLSTTAINAPAAIAANVPPRPFAKDKPKKPIATPFNPATLVTIPPATKPRYGFPPMTFAACMATAIFRYVKNVLANTFNTAMNCEPPSTTAAGSNKLIPVMLKINTNSFMIPKIKPVPANTGINGANTFAKKLKIPLASFFFIKAPSAFTSE